VSLLAIVLAAIIQTQQALPTALPTPPPFHWHDDYTEYHLLAPGTNQFHIVYFLSQRQPGLTYVLNQTRSGSEGSGISVSDPRTGAPLKFDYLTGKELAAAGVPGRLNAEEHYIRAHLPRPVPEGGEGRVRIEKTYKDEKSYFGSGDSITFARSLGIGRNAIVLPAGYKLVSSNVAALVELLADNRIRISFENINGYASDVNIRASKASSESNGPWGGGLAPASDAKKTLYELQPDGRLRITHQFITSGQQPIALFGNYGPHASMTAVDIDTGETLDVRGPATREQVPTLHRRTPLAEKISTAHIRVVNVFTDRDLTIRPIGLEWTRQIVEPRSTIVLPAGYELVNVTVPATIGTLPDGRVFVQLVNNRPASSLRVELRAARAR
jgi:hypothetical protein